MTAPAGTIPRLGALHSTDEDHGVVIDETGPGILWFVRHNHWHGSPWHYIVDGHETVVKETSTADPTDPVPGSVFIPQNLFPQGLTWTWSVTKGADLTWVPIPFEDSFQLNYGRSRYGTGYLIFWKLMPGMDHLSHPIESWTGSKQDEPPQEVSDLIQRSGTDIAPTGEGVTTRNGRFSLDPYETRTVLMENQAPAMMRRLAFRVPEEDAERLSKARLRIYWDGRKQPSVDAPLGLFFGTGSLMREENQEYIVESFPMTVKWEDGNFHFATYFPMPFHESMRIELAEMTGDPVENISWEVRHEPYTDPPNHVGLFHATYRFLLSDLMPFGRNAKITFEHGGENMSDEHYETVTYRYWAYNFVMPGTHTAPSQE